MLIDWTPLLQVALMLMGCGHPLPLTWWHLRAAQGHARPARRLRSLTVLTLFLTFDLIAFGAFTRLTDSGLGCPDWPGCYGHASPVAPGPKSRPRRNDRAHRPGDAWQGLGQR